MLLRQETGKPQSYPQQAPILQEATELPHAAEQTWKEG